MDMCSSQRHLFHIQGIEDSRDKSLRAVFDDDIRNFLDTVNSQKTDLGDNNGNATSGNDKACLTEEDLMQFLYRVELPLKRSFLNKARWSFAQIFGRFVRKTRVNEGF